jgi:hypothetical protein
MADRVYCRWCELLLKWYPTWATWGRAYGESTNKFRCRMRPEAGPEGELGHEPPEKD